MNCGVLLVFILLIISGVAALGVSEASEATAGDEEDLTSEVFLVSYRNNSSYRFLISEKSTVGYQNCELFVYAPVGSSFTVSVDSVQTSYTSAGLKKINLSFEVGTTHKINVVVGSDIFTYSFKVSKMISIKDLDDDVEEYVTLSESSFSLEKIKAAVFAFFAAFIGFFAAYKFIRYRASNGVRNV